MPPNAGAERFGSGEVAMDFLGCAALASQEWLDIGLRRSSAPHVGHGAFHHLTMRGRISVPIYDGCGDVVAYSGRSASNDVPDSDAKGGLPTHPRRCRALRRRFFTN
jgi:hypothetical protein